LPARSTATCAPAADARAPGAAWPANRLPQPVLAFERSAGRPGTSLPQLLAFVT